MSSGESSFYPGSDVLVNKYDIRSSEEARSAEYKFVAFRELQLAQDPIKGNFDFDHLQKIHKHLFQDMYDWAGKTRDIDTSRTNPETGLVGRFTPKEEIENSAKSFNEFVEKSGQLKGLAKPEFIAAMSEVHGKLNEMHAFREGNDRAARVYMQQISREAGYEFDMTKIDKDRWGQAAAKSMPGHDPKNVDAVQPASRFDIRQILHESVSPSIEKEKALSRDEKAALAFMSVKQAEALKEHPQLAGAYGVMAAFEKRNVADNMPLDASKAMLDQARKHVVKSIEQGFYPQMNVRVAEVERQANQAKPEKEAEASR